MILNSVAHPDWSRSQGIDIFKFQLSYCYNPLQDTCHITSAVLGHLIRTHVPLTFFPSGQVVLSAVWKMCNDHCIQHSWVAQYGSWVVLLLSVTDQLEHSPSETGTAHCTVQRNHNREARFFPGKFLTEQVQIWTCSRMIWSTLLVTNVTVKQPRFISSGFLVQTLITTVVITQRQH